MPRKAIKDTFAVEQIAGVEVRRAIFAGQLIPSVYEVDDDAYEEVQGGEESYGPSITKETAKSKGGKKKS